VEVRYKGATIFGGRTRGGFYAHGMLPWQSSLICITIRCQILLHAGPGDLRQPVLLTKMLLW
jgi:hypothetical protein